MGAESLRRRMRELLRAVLQELDVAGAYIEELGYAVSTQDGAHAPTALYRAWARAERAIASLEQVSGGGGFSERVVREELCVSRRNVARALAELLAMVRTTAEPVAGAGGSP